MPCSVCVLFVAVCLVSQQRRFESRSVVCGFVGSRSFRTDQRQTMDGCPLTYPAAPHIHPFVDSAADQTAAVRYSESPARIISRSTVPQARVVSIRPTSGARLSWKTTVPIHGPPQTDPHRGGAAPQGAVPMQPSLLLTQRQALLDEKLWMIANGVCGSADQPPAVGLCLRCAWGGPPQT